MLSILVSAVISLNVLASEVPKNFSKYSCATGASDKAAVTAEIFEAYDESWNLVYSSATIQDSAGRINFAGFVNSERRSEQNGFVIFATWHALDFSLTGKFIPSQPSRNFQATLVLKNGVSVSLFCTY